MSYQKVSAGFGVIILKEGKVLLGKRHDDPEKADSAMHGEGTWTLPGGKLDFHESFEGGAIREVKEETGLDLHDVEVVGVTNEMVEDAHFVTIGMLAKEFSGEPSVMEPDEITRWEWFSLDSLPEPMFPPSAHHLEIFRDKMFYKRF